MNSELVLYLIIFYLLFMNRKEFFGCGKCGTSQPHTEDDDHIHSVSLNLVQKLCPVILMVYVLNRELKIFLH